MISTLETKAAKTFYSMIRDRLIKYDQNWLAAIVGDTGSGKSMASLTIARHIFPQFNCRYFVHRTDDFIRLLNNKELICKGAVIIYDEAGADYSSREWRSENNKDMGVILQVFRYLNIGLIFTVPSLQFIDKQARMLMHHYFETKGINREKKLCYLSVKRPYMKFGKETQETKFQHFIYDGAPVFLPTLAVEYPDEALANEYKELSKKFKDEIIAERLKRIEAREKQERADQKPRGRQPILPERLQPKEKSDSDIFGNIDDVPFNNKEDGEGNKDGGFIDFR